MPRPGRKDPTKAAGLRVAATALKQGHAVTPFLVGEGERLPSAEGEVVITC